jgi:hypothetical protein
MSRSLSKVQNELHSVFLFSFEVCLEPATCPESKTKNLMSITKNSQDAERITECVSVQF